MTHVLDNVCWYALTSTLAHHAETVGGAIRFDPDVSVFAAVEAVDDAAWVDLAQLAGRSAGVVLFRDVVPDPPAGWTVDVRATGVQMVLEGDLRDDAGRGHAVTAIGPGLRELGPDDADQMMDLVAATTPGPFRQRTVELGGYVGYFDDGRLVAMAGERLSVDGYGEISAVCTHPDARGRGLAAALTRRVASGILDRGDVPYLQVAAGNPSARRIYERIGFVRRREVEFAMLTTPG